MALVYGADFVVGQSEKIANHFKISSFVIGATLVALGTSLPELAVSVAASIRGNADIAVANVVGSTIFNISLVLGMVFLIAKKVNPRRDLFARDSAWALFPILIFILMGVDGSLSRVDGVLFVLLMVAYVLFLNLGADRDKVDESKSDNFSWVITSLLLIIGFVLVVVGAEYSVKSAANIARMFNVSEWIIGMFLVAFGTSLPELIISIKSALKNNADLAIGNIIGSNVINFTMVLGLSAVFNPLTVDIAHNGFDIASALIVSVILVFITANRMYNKSAGLVLLITMIIVIENSLG